VLVVSSIDLTTKTPMMKPEEFLKSSIREDFTVNINNDYRYLKTGYYVSVHAETLGSTVMPRSDDIIAAYRTPIMLLKASKAGIPTMPYVVANSVRQIMSEIDFPVVLFAVNPFSYDGYRTAQNRSGLYRAFKSLGMNYKFTVCAQPLRGDLISANCLFGKCDQDNQVKRIAEQIYELFRIPIFKIHIQRVKDANYLCGLQPLKRQELSAPDLENISYEVSRMSSQGERLVG
jgi:hypothetical protein